MDLQELGLFDMPERRRKGHEIRARLEKENIRLREALKELVDIIDNDAVMDSFTTQPARAALNPKEEG